VIVGNQKVEKVERQSGSAYFTWDITWTLCNACNPTFLTGQVYPMLISSVPHAWGTLDRQSTLFKLIVKFFLKGVVFIFWHDIVYVELLYCVTNFELDWTWNKVAVVENAKKCRLYSTFPYFTDLWRAVVVDYSSRFVNVVRTMNSSFVANRVLWCHLSGFCGVGR